MITRGVLGLGCSFMWGEGLYFYSNLFNTPAMKKYHQFDGTHVLSESHIRFKNKNRFLRIVADEFGMWDISNVGNGGSNVRNIRDYAENVLNKNMLTKPADIGLVIYQFTASDRDFVNERRDENGWLIGDPMSIEDQIEFVNKSIKKWESNGIKVVTLSWYPDFPNHPLYNEYFKYNHVDIEVDGDIQNSFEYFLWKDEYNITISSDFKKYELQINDIHFNPKGHRCIANSIIKKLKNDSWQSI